MRNQPQKIARILLAASISLASLSLVACGGNNSDEQAHQESKDASSAPVDNHQADGLHIVVTSADAQTQMMAMVLSDATISGHQKTVNMVLCGEAGSLAMADTESPIIKPLEASPKAMMQELIQAGMDVQLCPLYLPNLGKDESMLIEGITVADPAEVSHKLLDKNYRILSY